MCDVSDDVCDESGEGALLMCPMCDKDCDFWLLHSSCLYSRLTYVFDNYATVAFAVFMSIWGEICSLCHNGQIVLILLVVNPRTGEGCGGGGTNGV